MQPRERTIVRVRIQETRPPRVFVLCGATAASRRALEFAARLAHQDHHVLEVIAGGEVDAAQLAEIEKTGLRVNLHAHPPGTDSLEMLREVENRLRQGLEEVARRHLHTLGHTGVAQVRLRALDGMFQIEQHTAQGRTCAQDLGQQLAMTAAHVHDDTAVRQRR